MKQGLIHLYWGDGKGKTTAAMGLALRALGAGKRVTIVQFLKGTDTGEIPLLRQMGASVYRGDPEQKFVFQMSAEEKAGNRMTQTQNLRTALTRPADLLILDEACAAWQLDMVDRALLRSAVEKKPAGQEVVLTGRAPADWMLAAAHYQTEMRCHRHPYDTGISARKGIEF